MDSAVRRMNEISGSRFLFSGVGTQMMIASTSLTLETSVEADSMPLAAKSRIAPPSMC